MGIKATNEKVKATKARILELEAKKIRETKEPKAKKSMKDANVTVNATSRIIAEQLHAQWGGLLSKKESEEITMQVFQGILNVLFTEERVALPSIGTLSLIEKPARVFRTFEGKMIAKPIRKGVKFSPSIAIKKQIFVAHTDVTTEKPAKAKK